MRGTDSKFYPLGIPLMFVIFHGAKHPEETYESLKALLETPHIKRKSIFYDGKWFESGKELKQYDPSLKCIA